jgi:hypothetical protein
VVKPFGIIVKKAVEKVVEADFSLFVALMAVMYRGPN